MMTAANPVQADWTNIKWVETWLSFLKAVDAKAVNVESSPVPANIKTRHNVGFVPDKDATNAVKLINFLKHLNNTGKKGIYRKELFAMRKEVGFAFDSPARLEQVIQSAIRMNRGVRKQYRQSGRHGRPIVWITLVDVECTHD